MERHPERAGLSVFHMAEFEHSRNWPQHKKDTILRKLAQAIHANTERPILHIVIMKDYKEINEKYAFEECIGTPYALAGRTVAKSLNDWKGRHKQERISVFFEDGTKHKGDFMAAMERGQLPCPAFIKKSDAIALQAADFLAWETLKALRTSAIVRPSLRKVLSGLSYDDPDIGVYAKKDLEDLCMRVGPDRVPLRSALTPNAHIAHHSSPKRKRKRSIGH